MIKKIVFVLLIFFTGRSNAQYILKFSLMSREKGIPGGIYIHEMNRVFATDSNGTCEVTEIPKGCYNFEFKSIGHQSIIEKICLPQAEFTTKFMHLKTENQIVFIKTNLEESMIEMKEMVISGNAGSDPNRSTCRVETINPDGLYESGRLTVMEELASKPGISLLTTGPGIARPVIRGLTGNRIVSINNGIKLENQQWDAEHTLGLNQYGTERIEIIKGPASLKYGSDAMGGVIHFTEERPAPLNQTQVDAVAGFNSNTFGTVSGIGIKSSREHSYWMARVGLNNQSDYYDGNFKRVANSRSRELLTKLIFGINHRKSSSQFTYQLNLGYYGIVEPFEADSNKTEKEDHPMEFETPYHTMIHHIFKARHSLFLGKTSVVATTSYQNDQRKELEPGNTEANPFLGFNLNVAGLDVKAERNFSNGQSLSMGIQGNYQSNSNSGYARLIPDYKQQDAGIYLLYRYVSQRLTLDLGTRYDMRMIKTDAYGLKDSVDYMTALDRRFENISSSIGIHYILTDEVSLYANSGIGFRSPNAAELTSNGVRLETQRYEIGNAGFAKETNLQSEAGIRMQNEMMEMELTAFTNSIAHFIYSFRRGDTLSKMPVYQFQQANATISGGEVSFKFHPPSMKWWMAETDFSALEGKLSSSEYLPLMPPYRSNTSLVIKRGQAGIFTSIYIKTGFVYMLARNKIGMNELTTPAYSLVNLAFGGELKVHGIPLKISMGVNNLLNEKAYDHLSRLRMYGLYFVGLNAFINIRIPIWNLPMK